MNTRSDPNPITKGPSQMIQRKLMYVETIYTFVCIYVKRGITDITATLALSQCTNKTLFTLVEVRIPLPGYRDGHREAARAQTD